MKRTRFIVAGTREFSDARDIRRYRYTVLRELDKFFASWPQQSVRVVSGCASGPDTYGIEWADRQKVPVTRFIADWTSFGKRAGYVRNREMAKYSDVLLVFWDGESRGTKHMIDLAMKHRLEIHLWFVGKDGNLAKGHTPPIT